MYFHSWSIWLYDSAMLWLFNWMHSKCEKKLNSRCWHIEPWHLNVKIWTASRLTFVQNVSPLTEDQQSCRDLEKEHPTHLTGIKIPTKHLPTILQLNFVFEMMLSYCWDCAKWVNPVWLWLTPPLAAATVHRGITKSEEPAGCEAFINLAFCVRNVIPDIPL